LLDWAFYLLFLITQTSGCDFTGSSTDSLLFRLAFQTSLPKIYYKGPSINDVRTGSIFPRLYVRTHHKFQKSDVFTTKSADVRI